MRGIATAVGVATVGARLLPDGAPTPTDLQKIQTQYFQADGLSQKSPDLPGPLTGMGLQENAQGQFNANRSDYSKGSIFFRKASQGIKFTASSPGTGTTTLGAIDFDLILEEEITLSAKVCQHPVQSGDPITDHIQPLPMAGRLKVLVTNYSLKYGPGGVSASAWSPSVNRALEAYDAFKALMLARTTVTLVTVLETFAVNSIVITRVSVPKTHDDGDSLTFTIDYVEIKVIAKLNTTPLHVSAKALNPTVPRNLNAMQPAGNGTQSPTNTPVPPSGIISAEGSGDGT
jgi:hypothetical protein